MGEVCCTCKNKNEAIYVVVDRQGVAVILSERRESISTRFWRAIQNEDTVNRK